MAVSEEDRKRMLQRDDMHPMDRWLIEECYPFHHSHLHVAYGLFARYIENRPVGDWMTTASEAIHAGGHTIADIAATVTPEIYRPKTTPILVTSDSSLSSWTITKFGMR